MPGSAAAESGLNPGAAGAAGSIDNPGTPGAGDDGTAGAAESVEEQAKALGWRPDYDGANKVDAAEWMRRKPLFDRLREQNQTIREMKKLTEGMAAQFKAATEAQYKRGIRDAEERIAAAEKAHDLPAYKQAQAEKAAIQQAQAEQAPADSSPPEVAEFMGRNSWFDTDREMTADAMEYRSRYLRAHPDAPLKDVLAYMETKIAKDYPDRVKPAAGGSSRRSAVPAVEGGGNAPQPQNPLAKLKASMTGEERRVMKMFVKPGGMTEDEYLTSYAQVRGEG